MTMITRVVRTVNDTGIHMTIQVPVYTCSLLVVSQLSHFPPADNGKVASESGSVKARVPPPAAGGGRLSSLMGGVASMPRMSISPQLEPGRVILAVPEGWNGGLIVDYFREQVGEALLL